MSKLALFTYGVDFNLGLYVVFSEKFLQFLLRILEDIFHPCFYSAKKMTRKHGGFLTWHKNFHLFLSALRFHG